MGKASKWFRGLLGLKKLDPNPNPAPKNPPKKKWSFSKSHKEKDHNKPQYGAVSGVEYDANRQAIAVAVATARVAEAAVAAAQAAAVAVNHTSKGRNTSANVYISQIGALYGRRREEWAAVMIQSHFRAYLSRRALRALKGLVKLQALVRGHLIRKRTAEALRQLQALVRAQRRAQIGRVLLSESPYSSIKSSHFNYPGPPTPENFEHVIRARNMNHNQSTTLKRNGSNGAVNYDLEKSHLNRFRTDNRMSERLREPRSFTSDRILKVDAGKLHITSKRRNLFHASSLSLGSDPNCQSFFTSKDSTARSSGEIQSLSPLKCVQDVEESVFCTADNSPQFYSVSSSKKDDYTPTKSDGSKSCFSNYSDSYYPSYMGYTESSKAKVRSLSAPKQRLSQYERSSSGKRYSVHGGYSESRSGTQLQANFVNKAYPGSGRLDQLGMPVRGDVAGFSDCLYNRY